MKLNFNINVLSIFIVFLFINILSNRINAQNVAEPPIPINNSYTHNEDSLMAAFESFLPTDGLALVYALKKYDTLQLQLQKSSAESTAHFTWLYALIALLGTMNIVLLFSTSRIRKELAQIRYLEHHQKLASSIPLLRQEQTEAKIPVRISNTLAKKKRDKNKRGQ